MVLGYTRRKHSIPQHFKREFGLGYSFARFAAMTYGISVLSQPGSIIQEHNSSVTGVTDVSCIETRIPIVSASMYLGVCSFDASECVASELRKLYGSSPQQNPKIEILRNDGNFRLFTCPVHCVHRG